MENTKLYNMILPIFMLYVFAPAIWIISIIGNLVIDSISLIVLLIIFKKLSFKTYIKTIIPLWIFGFVADFIGAGYLTLMSINTKSDYYVGKEDLLRQIKSGVYLATNHSPFDSLWGVVFILSGILMSSVLIFVFDYFFLINIKELNKKQRIISALTFCIVTAPYTFFLPKEFFI